MRQIHTQARKANRRSAFSKEGNSKMMSIKRFAKRKHLQPKERPCLGLQIRRVQTIKLEKYNGVRMTVVKNIYHAEA